MIVASSGRVLADIFIPIREWPVLNFSVCDNFILMCYTVLFSYSEVFISVIRIWKYHWAHFSLVNQMRMSAHFRFSQICNFNAIARWIIAVENKVIA